MYRNSIELKEQIFSLLAEGLRDKEISECLGWSQRAIRKYIRIIYDDLHLEADKHPRVLAALWWHENRKKIPASESYQ